MNNTKLYKYQRTSDLGFYRHNDYNQSIPYRLTNVYVNINYDMGGNDSMETLLRHESVN